MAAEAERFRLEEEELLRAEAERLRIEAEVARKEKEQEIDNARVLAEK